MLVDLATEDLIGLGVVDETLLLVLVMIDESVFDKEEDDDVLMRTLKSIDVFSFGSNIVWLFVGVPARPLLVVVVGEVGEFELVMIGSRPKLKM